jgi:hypothetical protein
MAILHLFKSIELYYSRIKFTKSMTLLFTLKIKTKKENCNLRIQKDLGKIKLKYT